MSNAARTIRSHQPQPDHSETHEKGLSARSNVDAQELAEELRRRIRGEVRFDDDSRALYATDASNYRQVPIGVVIPRDKEDVIETIAAAHRAGAPVLARGGNNSCGVHSMMGGKTDDNIEELEILTYDGFRMRVGATGEAVLARIIREGGRRGEIYSRLKTLRDRYADLIRQRFPDIPRCVSGYNLTWLLPEKGFHIARALVGSECTCVMVLEATTRLVHSPPGRALLVLGYRDVYSAADHVVDVLDHKPIGLEGIDDKLSLKIGELVSLPAVREAPEDTLIIADGLAAASRSRRLRSDALHSAEVIQMAINSATNDLKDQT